MINVNDGKWLFVSLFCPYELFDFHICSFSLGRMHIWSRMGIPLAHSDEHDHKDFHETCGKRILHALKDGTSTCSELMRTSNHYPLSHQLNIKWVHSHWPCINRAINFTWRINKQWLVHRGWLIMVDHDTWPHFTNRSYRNHEYIMIANNILRCLVLSRIGAYQAMILGITNHFERHIGVGTQQWWQCFSNKG